MTTTQIVILVAVVAVLAIILVARTSGPRITTIETRRDHSGENGE